MDFRLVAVLLAASPALAEVQTSHVPVRPSEGNCGQGHEKWHHI